MCRAIGANLSAKVKLTAIFLEVSPISKKKRVPRPSISTPLAKAGLQSAG